MTTFYSNYYFFAWNSGAPYTRGPLDFAYPAYPTVTPLRTTSKQFVLYIPVASIAVGVQ